MKNEKELKKDITRILDESDEINNLIGAILYDINDNDEDTEKEIEARIDMTLDDLLYYIDDLKYRVKVAIRHREVK